jgi:hypothetical protein
MHDSFRWKCDPLHMGMDSFVVFKALDPPTFYIYTYTYKTPNQLLPLQPISSILPFWGNQQYVHKQAYLKACPIHNNARNNSRDFS